VSLQLDDALLVLLGWVEEEVGEGGDEVEQLGVEVVVQVGEGGGAVQKEAERVEEGGRVQGGGRGREQERGVQARQVRIHKVLLEHSVKVREKFI